MVVFLHPPYWPDLALVIPHFFVTAIAATTTSFPVCSWNSGTISHLSTSDSKKSVPAVLPAVAESCTRYINLEGDYPEGGKNRPITAVRGFPLWTQSGNFWIRPLTVYFMILPSSWSTEWHVIHTPCFAPTRGPTRRKFSLQYFIDLCIHCLPYLSYMRNPSLPTIF
jgi:hypothetical protein